MAQENRDVTFDILKGFGIFLMLCGHYWPDAHWAHQIIYSFHMPLFFLVAGYFSKPLNMSVWSAIKKSAKRLLLPFLVTQLLLVAWGGIQSMAKHDVSYVIKPFLSLLWGGTDVIDSRYGMIYVGPIWFLSALFWAKIVFECLITKIQGWRLLFICVAMSVMAIMLHKFTSSPWNVLQGLSLLTFLSIGYLAKQKLFPNWAFWLALICWPVSAYFSGMEVADCRYQMYPLDVLGACGGTLFMWWIANQIKRWSVLSIAFVWFGVNSLIVLCFHNFEWFSAISYSVVVHVPFDIHGNWMILFRFVMTLAMVLLAIQIPVVRDVYGARKMKI